MKLTEIYTYVPLVREDGGPDGRKYVDPTGNRLSSVTTILDATKTEEKKKALEGWRRSVGDKRADEIRDEAAFRGTLMHSYLERHLRGENPVAGTNLFHRQAHKMAGIILKEYLEPCLNEWWGLETNLYYPDLYAGTTDVVGVYNGKPSIVDFKQSNKIKTDVMVSDYKLQLVAYAMAHNNIYGTSIDQGVILMCTKDLYPQTWTLAGDEFNYYSNMWLERVAQYHEVLETLTNPHM